MERTILHCDCNGFFASVECVRAPQLREVPMAVCGNPENRHGIILAKNELAKRCGVTTAETIWQARKKCPELVLVPPHHEEYARYSRLVNAIYARYTDLVEPFGIDESWLDVTGSRLLFGDGPTIADRLRREVREELGLTISVGVSFNKVFAKLGSDYRKPDATTVIPRDKVAEIVYPLPVSDLLYVGKAAAQTLNKLYIRTIGDLARADRTLVVKALGKLGEMIHDYANGLDDSPVRSIDDKREVKSVGNGITFSRNLVGWADIHVGVLALADSVASRLRAAGLKCQTVQVIVKNPALKSISRQQALSASTDLAREISDAAMRILRGCWNERAPIRMLTITALQLTTEDTGEQLSLFEPDPTPRRERQERLEAAMDRIRGKYGHAAIQSCAVWKNDIGAAAEEKDGEAVDHPTAE